MDKEVFMHNYKYVIRFWWISLTALLLPITLRSQVTFERYYGGLSDDYGYSVQQTFDSGYIIAGTTESFGAGMRDVYLIKTDSLGDTIWTRTYGGSLNDEGYSVQQTSDSGYIIAGAKNFWTDTSAVYLIKTNQFGVPVWEKTYRPEYTYAYGQSVQQTADGGYIVVGIHSLNTVYLVKTDSMGDTVWTKGYDWATQQFGYSVQQTSDSGYIITGCITGPAGFDVLLIKTDSLGDSIWAKTYHPSDAHDYGWCVRQAFDGGYIVAVESQIEGAMLLKANSMGDSLWAKNYYIGQSANAVQQTTDSGFVITGTTGSYLKTFLVKTNSAGDTLWTRTHGVGQHNIGYSVQQTSDGGYIIGGATDIDSISPQPNDFHLIKTDSLGYITGIKESSFRSMPDAFYLAQNNPNPFRSVTYIRYCLPKDGPVELVVYDLSGQLVRILVKGEESAGIHSVNWDGKNEQGLSVSSGVYFYQLKASGGVKNTRKMLLLR
jgi:hypothetical protein